MLEVQETIEARNAHHSRARHAKSVCEMGQGRRRQPTVELLRFPQDLQQGGRSAPVTVHNDVERGAMFGHGDPASSLNVPPG
jgi:hypothetical protein